MVEETDKPITDQEFERDLPRHFRRGLGVEQQPVAARWATSEELAGPKWQWRPGAWFLGYRDGKTIGRVDDRHLLLAAGSRAGKGVSVIIPNCLLWPGSLLAIDPKGELAKKTAGHRSRGGKRPCVILDPFGVSGHAAAGSFNPLAEIAVEPETDDYEALSKVSDQVSLIADALIIPSGGGDQHWTDAAKQLVKGLILFALTLPEAERNLLTVRDLLMLKSPRIKAVEATDDDGKPMPPIAKLWLLLEACDAFDGIVSGIGSSFGCKPPKEAASILSTAQTQTDFLDSPALADCLQDSSFRLRDLKRQHVSVYLCLPASHMGTHARWLRMVINLALAALEGEAAAKETAPVLLVLEEFNCLGHMASIATAAGQIAGFGVRLLTVLQDLTQLKAHYRESWETFIGNAGLFLAFGNADATTLKYLSDKLGTVSIAVENRNQPTAQASLGGASGLSYNTQAVPLLASHEVEQAFARERQRLLVLYAGGKPMMLRRSISHEDARFKPLLDLPLWI